MSALNSDQPATAATMPTPMRTRPGIRNRVPKDFATRPATSLRAGSLRKYVPGLSSNRAPADRLLARHPKERAPGHRRHEASGQHEGASACDVEVGLRALLRPLVGV